VLNVTTERGINTIMATVKESSKMHRLEVGDIVSYEDISEWPPIHKEGPITEFANVELTYIVGDFDGAEMTLTEDEVTRIS
jgi:hypothetical protein